MSNLNSQSLARRGGFGEHPPHGSPPRQKPRNRRLPHRGVRPGPARFEILVTLSFVVSMVVAVVAGGPTDLARAAVIAVPYFLLGLLVVRRGLFVVTALPIVLSVFFDDRTSHELRLENPQVIFWMVGVLLWAPALVLGYSIRKWFDR